MTQFGLFNYHKRLTLIDKAGDPLVELNKAVDWEQVSELIEWAREKPRKSLAGAKGYDSIFLLTAIQNRTKLKIEDRY